MASKSKLSILLFFKEGAFSSSAYFKPVNVLGKMTRNFLARLLACFMCLLIWQLTSIIILVTIFTVEYNLLMLPA